VNWEALEPGILGPAFAAGLLVLATHVPLGIQVLARGIVFIDLAVAQMAGTGVIAAHALGWELEGWAVQAAAAAAALAGAVLLTWTDRRWPGLQEALIGTLFILAATAGVLLLSGDVRGGEHLRELLVGQILWVGAGQLAPAAVLTALLLAAWFGLGPRLGRLGFYLVFALAVTASVQLVGIYLVFASLIIPALATGRKRPRLAWAYAVGVAGYLLGLALAAVADLPPGALVVWSLGLCGAVVALLRRGTVPAGDVGVK
jgi:zinc/manganese transport system permease protein